MATSATKLVPATSRQSGSYKSIATIVLSNAVLVGLWASGLAPRLAAENGILETLQLLFAAGALSVFVFAALEDDGAIGTAGAALAALATIALLREIDVRRFAVPDWMLIWADSVYRDTTIVVLLLLVVVYAWRHRKHLNAWLDLVLRWRSWPIWLSVVAFACSVVVERGSFFASDVTLLLEEIAEFNGFMLLLIAAWRHCHVLRPTAPPE